MSVVNAERSHGDPLFLVSAGNFYGTADVFNESKNHFVARMMGWMGYDAVAVGNMDLGHGLDALVGDVEAYRLNVTCANLLPRGERRSVGADTPSARNGMEAAARHGTVFPPYLIGEKDGVRVGFVALIAPNTVVRSASGTAPEGSAAPVEAVTWKITDPLAAAAAVIPEVRERCDVVVVLAHMDATDIGTLMAEVPGIDFVVGGHDSRTVATGEPGRIGDAWLVKATARGQNVGVAVLELGDDGGIVDVKNRIHFLDDSYDDDAEAVAMLDTFDKENRKQQKQLYAKQQLRSSGGGDASSPIYLGVGTCQSCHLDAFEVYRATAHSRAFETLASQFVHRDTNCVGCHVTGYLEAGGFSGIRARGARIDLIDVQCEACHGPGSQHNRDGSYLELAAKSCVKCHTGSEDPDFDFARDWQKIEH